MRVAKKKKNVGTQKEFHLAYMAQLILTHVIVEVLILLIFNLCAREFVCII